MKAKLSKICLILAVVFTAHVSTAVACFNCEKFQVKKTTQSHCGDVASESEGAADKTMSCCCFNSPIKNGDSVKVDFNPLSLVILTLVDDPIESIQSKPILNFSLKRYRPFSSLSSANPLALKQSFLI